LSLPFIYNARPKTPTSHSVHNRHDDSQFAVILLLDGNRHPHHFSGALMFDCRFPVTMNSQVRGLKYPASAQALEYLAKVDAPFAHPTLGVRCQDHAIAVASDPASLLQKACIGQTQWLDRAHTHKGYGLAAKCQCI